MSTNFVETAAKLAGIVSASIGWTPDQFWSATPAELTAIFAAYADVSNTSQTAPLSSRQFEKLKEDHPDGQRD